MKNILKRIKYFHLYHKINDHANEIPLTHMASFQKWQDSLIMTISTSVVQCNALVSMQTQNAYSYIKHNRGFT